MQHQDWDPIIVRSNGATKTRTGSKTTVPAAVQAIRKTENSEVIARPLTLTGKSRSEMAQIRVSKGWTQKQLDMQGQFPANSCNAWEAGKLCPTGPQLQKLHRILGIKLERE